MDKLIIFTDFATLLVPTLLTEATLQATCNRNDLEVSGVCIRNFQKYHYLLLRHARTVMKNKIKRFFDYSQNQRSNTPLPSDIERLARRYRFKIILPPDQNINNRKFIKQLKTKLKPTIALSYYCFQKFSPDLLKIFDYSANYHNGLLPGYRGVKATCWSLYQGDSETGVTFHRMNEKFDEGNILLRGAVPVGPGSSVTDLEYEKALKAVNDIPRLIEILINREPGQAQVNESNYFSEKDFQNIKRIDDPSKHSSFELMRRLRAFGSLIINIGGKWYDVTKLAKKPAPPKNQGELYFQTRDGVIMQPSRFCYVPFPMYQVLNWIRCTLARLSV